MNPSEFFGVTHINPSYAFGDQPSLIEGARRIRELGSKTIKVYLSPTYRQYYRFKTNWPEYGSPVELAGDPLYCQLFEMDFTTIIIGAFSFCENGGAAYWQYHFNAEDEALEYKTMYDLTFRLLKEYAGTGKTFILQNWESDCASMPTPDQEFDPAPEVFERCIRWANVRQNAVSAARADAGVSGVNVYHALEVNFVMKGVNGRPCVTNNVLPYVSCDMYSYSAYDAPIAGEEAYVRALDYLMVKAAPSALLGRNNIMIGEFGLPENEYGTERLLDLCRFVWDVSASRGIRHIVYWELYDNECPRGDAQSDADCRGYWLVKPSGIKTAMWNYFQKRLGEKF